MGPPKNILLKMTSENGFEERSVSHLRFKDWGYWGVDLNMVMNLTFLSVEFIDNFDISRRRFLVISL
jgi:hypothetical protein